MCTERYITRLVLAAALLAPCPVFAQLLTGEVYSRQAQEIIVPLTTTWKASISKLAEEGSLVQPGDVVVEFDGSQASQSLEQQRETTRAEAAMTDRDIAQLEKSVTTSGYAVELAEVELELAQMKAEIPKGLIGAIEHAENQLAAERAVQSLDDARAVYADTQKQLAERQQQAELDRRKSELTEAWWAEMLETLSVEATQPGYVIHLVHPWNRSKFQEGDNVQTSFKVALVADTSDLAVKVWVNSVDRPNVQAGADVNITLDAMPDRELSGTLVSISDAGAKRDEWGTALYYEGIVSFNGADTSELLPGMSVLVEML